MTDEIKDDYGTVHVIVDKIPPPDKMVRETRSVFATFIVNPGDLPRLFLPHAPNRKRAFVHIHAVKAAGVTATSYGYLSGSSSDAAAGVGFYISGAVTFMFMELFGTSEVWIAPDVNSTTSMTISVVSEYED